MDPDEEGLSERILASSDSAPYISVDFPSSSFGSGHGNSQEMEWVESSPERMAPSLLEPGSRDGPIFDITKFENLPLGAKGPTRRHTFTSVNRQDDTVNRKRLYYQCCDPDITDTQSMRRQPFPRTKIHRQLKTVHPAEAYASSQKTKLLDLPSELLASIIVFVIESPPEITFSQGPVRRWTLGTTPNSHETSNLDISSILNIDNKVNHYENSQYKDEAFYPSRMLNSIASTCRRLRRLVRLEEWDVLFWRPAARLYYHLTYYPKVLPDSLGLIQGFLPTNQTSWRNFLTCTIQYIDTRRRGVESFGTKAGCKPATRWKVFQDGLRGSRKHEYPSQPRTLMMLCRQPGPDLLDVAWDAATERYTIAMGLAGGKAYASVDRTGNFTRGEELRPDLMRSARGLFPADILEVKNDRFGIVKVGAIGLKNRGNLNSLSGASPPKSSSAHPIRALQDVLRWDLSCVPEVMQDEKARIARCASWSDYLCFTLFKQNFADPTAPLLDPAEDSMVYCIKAEPKLEPTYTASRKYRCELLWHYNFGLDTQNTEYGKRREPAVCHIALSASYAAILLRWNNTSVVKNIVDDKRQIYILDIRTGNKTRCFNLPAFDWDFRHSDMGNQYNQIRLDKLHALYDDPHAAHRATRVHDDKLILLESDSPNPKGYPSAKIITGSHDYCNWVWDISQASDNEPLIVLDDFYWDTDTQGEQLKQRGPKRNKWSRFKERAGWWCSTPNQVLDFWHDFSITPDGRFFAAIRAGRTFIWDLSEDRPTIKGYTSEPEDGDVKRGQDRHDQSLERYLGRPTEACNERHGHAFLRWFEYKGRIPEQGLWMVFDDWSVVYLDRHDILIACGLSHREWTFSENDFESIHTNMRSEYSASLMNDEDDYDSEGNLGEPRGQAE